MWVTKLLIFPVEIKNFCPRMTKFGPKLAFLVNLGQVMQAYSMPCCGSAGGCGARAVSRKTPIYFICICPLILFDTNCQLNQIVRRQCYCLHSIGHEIQMIQLLLIKMPSHGRFSIFGSGLTAC